LKSTEPTAQAAPFPTTRSSLVAGVRSAEPAERARSLEAVVRAYWRAVYKHLRARWRMSRQDAEDLTQSFFAVALEKDYLASYDAGRGRFRTYLRICADRFASKDHRDGRREKRGGGIRPLSLDFGAAEGELSRQLPASPAIVEQLFDDEWRRTLFALAIEALRVELEAAGHGEHYRLFERYDLREEEATLTYADLARELGVPVTTVTNRLARVRRELRRHVIEQLGAITSTEGELREEARALLGIELPPRSPVG
jgi:RNA polymerase sigma factor (sigma-70 family)